MIRPAIALLGAITCFSAPALAQSFSHTHGASGFHSHDTTITTTSGTCCQTVHTCGHASHSGHHGSHHGHNGHSSHHSAHHGHTSHTTHNPHVTRTWTRRIVHPETTTRTWTRTVPGTVIHRESHTHSGHNHGQVTIVHPAPVAPHVIVERDPVYAPLHTDRDRAWSHYDRRWKSRTRRGFRSRH